MYLYNNTYPYPTVNLEPLQSAQLHKIIRWAFHDPAVQPLYSEDAIMLLDTKNNVHKSAYDHRRTESPSLISRQSTIQDIGCKLRFTHHLQSSPYRVTAQPFYCHELNRRQRGCAMHTHREQIQIQYRAACNPHPLSLGQMLPFVIASPRL